jgi:hypothetical protein
MSENMVYSSHKLVQNIAFRKFVAYQYDHQKCRELCVISQNSGSVNAGKHVRYINNWDPLEYMQLGTTGLGLLSM